MYSKSLIFNTISVLQRFATMRKDIINAKQIMYPQVAEMLLLDLENKQEEHWDRMSLNLQKATKIELHRQNLDHLAWDYLDKIN